MRDDDGHEHKCGKSKDGKAIARKWAQTYNENRILAEAGQLPAQPRACLWTVKDLRLIDLQEAKNRGLRTSLPQPHSKASKRESLWKNLAVFFKDELPLDQITDATLRAYIADRQRSVGPVPINRELWGVLRPALRLARDSSASGYSGDPFRGLHKLDEKAGKREGIAVPPKEWPRLVRLARGERPDFGAWVETQLLTASRPGQSGAAREGFLRYGAHKRGIPRAFTLKGRLRGLAKVQRRYSRRCWLRLVEAFGMPDLKPHDLRHSAITAAGKHPKASLDSLRALGGWKTSAIADTYLHPDRRAIDPVLFGDASVTRPKRKKRRKGP